MFLFGAPGSLCGFFPMVSVLLTKSVVFVLEFANLSGTIIRSERRSHHGSIGRANQISLALIIERLASLHHDEEMVAPMT